MQDKNIDIAVAEAKRFLERAETFKKAPRASYVYEGTTYFYAPPPKESGALRRASLDLTRALADMRKP